MLLRHCPMQLECFIELYSKGIYMQFACFTLSISHSRVLSLCSSIVWCTSVTRCTAERSEQSKISIQKRFVACFFPKSGKWMTKNREYANKYRENTEIETTEKKTLHMESLASIERTRQPTTARWHNIKANKTECTQEKRERWRWWWWRRRKKKSNITSSIV